MEQIRASALAARPTPRPAGQALAARPPLGHPAWVRLQYEKTLACMHINTKST